MVYLQDQGRYVHIYNECGKWVSGIPKERSRAGGKLTRTHLLSVCDTKHSPKSTPCLTHAPGYLGSVQGRQAGIQKGLCEGDGEQRLESKPGTTRKNTLEKAGATLTEVSTMIQRGPALH